EGEMAGVGTAQLAAASADEFIPIVPPPVSSPPPVAHPKLGRPTMWFEYANAQGELEGYVCRFERPNAEPGQKPKQKTFLPLRYGTLRGSTGWHWKGWAGSSERPLYGLRDLLARPDAPILVVEGEKKRDAAAARFPDHAVVSPMNGAAAPAK